MLIKVTQSHIDRGCRGDGEGDPIALALLETGFWPKVENDKITLRAAGSTKVFHVATPPEVSLFINDFDDGEPVKPFEFELGVEGVEIAGRADAW